MVLAGDGGAAAIPVVIVQGGAANLGFAGGITTLSKAFVSSLTSGNTALAHIVVSSNATLTSITDGANTWVIDAGPIATVGAGYGVLWFAHASNVVAGATTVTAHFASSVGADIQLYEVSGLKASPFSTTHQTHVYDTSISNPFTPATAPAFAFGSITVDSGTITTYGATNGWTHDGGETPYVGLRNLKMSLVLPNAVSYDADATTPGSDIYSTIAVYLGN
jgi:hypothetical protein